MNKPNANKNNVLEVRTSKSPLIINIFDKEVLVDNMVSKDDINLDTIHLQTSWWNTMSCPAVSAGVFSLICWSESAVLTCDKSC